MESVRSTQEVPGNPHSGGPHNRVFAQEFQGGASWNGGPERAGEALVAKLKGDRSQSPKDLCFVETVTIRCNPGR